MGVCVGVCGCLWVCVCVSYLSGCVCGGVCGVCVCGGVCLLSQGSRGHMVCMWCVCVCVCVVCVCVSPVSGVQRSHVCSKALMWSNRCTFSMLQTSRDFPRSFVKDPVAKLLADSESESRSSDTWAKA